MSEWFSNIRTKYLKLEFIGATQAVIIISIAALLLALIIVAIVFLPFGKIKYENISITSSSTSVASTTEENVPLIPAIKHLKTPDPLKAVYMSSWSAGSMTFRKHILDLASTTEINAVVIDVKDYTGKIGFRVDDPELNKFNSTENRIPDIKEFIEQLHGMNVYVIGRISSFQDSELIKSHPEWAVKNIDGTVWKDNKGVKWLEVGARPVWDYLVQIAKYSYSIGFDEINFDYIRFPSDGNLKSIQYAWTRGRARPEVLKEFYAYLKDNLSGTNASTSVEFQIPISADLFGLTTSATGDLGIGQVLEDALKYFDYVSPMVYPSHYGYGFNGIARPATKPYEVVKYAMDEAVKKAQVASTSPSKLRPWLQDFDLGTPYTPAMVRAQIQATYDSGLTSWMMWDAGVTYQKTALLGKNVVDTIAEIKPLPIPVIATSTASTTISKTNSKLVPNSPKSIPKFKINVMSSTSTTKKK